MKVYLFVDNMIGLERVFFVFICFVYFLNIVFDFDLNWIEI